jgi:heme/copper-type cytochrome/quinol oxidase subunit 2
MLAVGIILAIPTIIWLWCIVDILKNEFTGYNKIIWFLVVIILPVLGIILYTFIGQNQKTTSSGKGISKGLIIGLGVIPVLLVLVVIFLRAMVLPQLGPGIRDSMKSDAGIRDSMKSDAGITDSMKSDARNVQTMEEVYFGENHKYISVTATSGAMFSIGSQVMTMSKGNSLSVVAQPPPIDKYVITVTNPRAATGSTSYVTDNDFTEGFQGFRP